MGNTASEQSVKDLVNDEIKEDVDDAFLGLFNDLTSKMNLKELEILRKQPDYNWIDNHWANKVNSNYNRQMIDTIIDKKIEKEQRRSFGIRRRTSRKLRRSKKLTGPN
jgi:hypothetical protein